MRPDVCVIGGGPAGATLATRLAQLGHEVCLVERSRFPRRHLGESLSPGVLPLLEMTGARAAVERAGFTPVRAVSVKWEAGDEERKDERQQGLLVDRARFDRIVLDRAVEAGVQVLHPATITERIRRGDGWRIRVRTETQRIEIEPRLLADATGRASALRGRRRRTGPRTMALYAYWRGDSLPKQPRIEAGDDAWYWGVPLPDGTYNTLVFVDAERLRGSPPPALASRFRELIDRSTLMAACRGARLVSPVRAADATPYLDEDAVSAQSIKVGDSALAIDPLSSSGVQKAVQSALSGAIVANTLLRRPESAAPAMSFHRDSLADASRRHRAWAESHYATVSRRSFSAFWAARAADSAPGQPAAVEAVTHDARAAADAPLDLSPDLEFVDVPCIDHEFVTLRPALRHPALDGPLAYLGGSEVATLLRGLRPGATALDAARSWSSQVPLERGLMLASWLVSHGLLVRRER